jgi:hypothetical protein
MALESPVKQWGLLSWNDRYAMVVGTKLSICKEVGVPPTLVFDLKESSE